MDNIIKLIEEEKVRINNELGEVNKTVEFFKAFKEKNYCTNVDGVAKCDRVELATILIMNQNAEVLDIYDVLGSLAYARGFLDIADQSEKAVEVFDFLDKLLDENQYQKAIDYFSGKKKFKLIESIKGESLLIKSFEDCLNHHKINTKEFVHFMEIYRICPMTCFRTFSVVGSFMKASKQKEESLERLDTLSEIFGVKVKDKEKTKFLNSQLSYKWDVDGMMSYVRDALNYGQSLISKDSSRRRNLSKQLKIYDELIVKLKNALSGGEITRFEELVSKVPNDEIRLEILKLIYKHNMEIYEGVKSDYEYLSLNDTTHYKVLLAKYGIDLSNTDINKIMKNNIRDVSEILETLKSIGFVESKDLIKILECSDLDVVKRLSSLVQCGVINNELLSNNIILFNSDSREYSYLLENISVLDNFLINSKIFKNSCSVLLTSPDVFKKNLTVLKNYGLISCMKNSYDYSFLNSDHLYNGIDLLLELGYESILEEDLSILNYKDKFMRLRLLKELNIPVNTKYELVDVLTTDKFYMRDEDISSYIYNGVKYNLPSVNKNTNKSRVVDSSVFDSFLSSSRVYSFNGVLISKNKVIRNLRVIDDSGDESDRRLFSILYGSVLNDDEIANIKNCLGINKEM